MHDIRHTWQFLGIIQYSPDPKYKFACWETSAKTISGRLRRGHPGETKRIAQQTKSADIISDYLSRTNGQLLEMNVKIVSSYLQAVKAFDPCNMISN